MKVDKKMKKWLLFLLFNILVIILGAYLWNCTNSEEPKAAILDATPEVFVFTTVSPLSTPTPELTPVHVVVSTPIPTPELRDYDYPGYEKDRISKAIFSVTPESPTEKTKIAFAEIPQNMVDDYKKREANHEKIQYYRKDITSNLLMKTEFPSFNGDCYKNLPREDERKKMNDEIADYVMRSWYYANITGDRSYRLTPQSGVRYNFYNIDGWDYIKIYDLEWNLVYDSGEDILNED